MAYLQTDVTKVTTRVLQNMKLHGEKIAMLTAYDFSMAQLLDRTKIDVVLVGDSDANVMEGYKTTLPIPRSSFVDQMELNKFEEDIYFDFREHIDDKHEGEIEFEPDTRSCLIYLEAAYLRTDVYFALVDSAAAEQGARRTAMKSATDNATEMIATLTRIYNRERQGAITTEISEIVGGAAALEE